MNAMAIERRNEAIHLGRAGRQEGWGDDQRMIEAWFAAGDTLEYDLDWELRYGAATAWEEF